MLQTYLVPLRHSRQSGCQVAIVGVVPRLLKTALNHHAHHLPALVTLQQVRVQCSTEIVDRVPTSALASEPRDHEGGQRGNQHIPVSQVTCEGTTAVAPGQQL